MDALLQSLKEISEVLLPILGAAVLIFLIVILKKVYDILKTVNPLIDRVNKTMDVVEHDLDQLQSSLSVINGVANGIISFQSFAQNNVLGIANFAASNFEWVKDWVAKIMAYFKKPEDVEEAENVSETEDIEIIQDELRSEELV